MGSGCVGEPYLLTPLKLGCEALKISVHFARSMRSGVSQGEGDSVMQCTGGAEGIFAAGTVSTMRAPQAEASQRCQVREALHCGCKEAAVAQVIQAMTQNLCTELHFQVCETRLQHTAQASGCVHV